MFHYFGSIPISITHGTTFSHIAKLEEEAKASRGPVQQLPECLCCSFYNLYCPDALLIWVTGGFLAWNCGKLLSWDNRSFSGTETVMVFAVWVPVPVLAMVCPCSLRLITPAAWCWKQRYVLLLSKAGELVGTAHRVQMVASDRTGAIPPHQRRQNECITSSNPEIGGSMFKIIDLLKFDQEGGKKITQSGWLRLKIEKKKNVI